MGVEKLGIQSVSCLAVVSRLETGHTCQETSEQCTAKAATLLKDLHTDV